MNARHGHTARPGIRGGDYAELFAAHAGAIATTIATRTRCSVERGREALQDVLTDMWARGAPCPTPADVVKAAGAIIRGERESDDPPADVDFVHYRTPPSIGAQSRAFDKAQPRHYSTDYAGPGVCDRCGAHVFWVELNNGGSVHKHYTPSGRLTVSEGAPFIMCAEIVRDKQTGRTYSHTVPDKHGRNIRHVCRSPRNTTAEVT